MTAQSPFLPGTNIQFAWDSTSLGLFKTCPRLYQYTMIEGWSSGDESVHLRFGIEFHKALEDFDRKIATGTVRPDAIREVVHELLTRTHGWAPDESTKAGKYKNRRSVVQLVIDYLDHYANDTAETYIKADGAPAVELSFRFELDWGPQQSTYREGKFDTPTGQPYLLCGHLDRVVSFNDDLYVMDRKTTTTTPGSYYFDQYQPHNQMTLYSLAAQVILDAPVRGVIIDAAQVLLEKPNNFVRGMTFRTADQLEEWMTDLRHWFGLQERYATEGHFPMNDTACDKFGGCRFREVCSRSPQVRDNLLRSKFTKLPEEEKWNPLRSRG